MINKYLIHKLSFVFNLLKNNLELLVWLTGLMYLILIDLSKNHFSFCPLNQMGFDWCPGCGLGMSISLIFHFEFAESLKVHPLGFFALIIIVFRIIQLIKNQWREHHGKYIRLSP